MSVTLDGVKETLRALRKFDPELLKEMNKEIKGVMIPIRDKAREYAPTAAPGGRAAALTISTAIRARAGESTWVSMPITSVLTSAPHLMTLSS